MTKATLVLEGGATRGVFTSGALDYLMEKEQYLTHVIGVSAGSCNGVDYVSRQPGRTRDCMIHKEKKYGYYYSLRKSMKEKSLFNMDMVFDKYPNELFPFDYDTYFASEAECEIVVTNCSTGQAEYLKEHHDKKRLMRLCMASCSMPLVSPIVNIDGIPYLDGGLADSIPVKRAMEEGNDKIVLILTRNPGYRKKMPSRASAKLYRRAYPKYPHLVQSILRRNASYNRVAGWIERLEEQKRIFVLRPMIPTVSRIEKDYDILMNFYSHGYKLMKQEYERLLRFLEQ